MNRVEPLQADAIAAEVAAIVAGSDQQMGFAANDIRVMAKWPALLQAMAGVVGVVYAAGAVDAGLKRMVGHIASTAAGCRYCQAHTAHGSAAAGIEAAKLAAIWGFETSPLFNAAERAALRVARGGGSQPNGVTDADFNELRAHFSEQQILEIVAVIALFGFLNRWNETLATELEAEPGHFTTDPRPP